ncbi:MAG: hypothetical protein EON52_12380 [Actinomycetales bacterium]|nr:MAG: hypothetical protein EON52_12380 [Actinomycetales bacterium]
MDLLTATATAADVPPEVLLAHPVALLAIPALAPAVVLIGVVLWIARRDRLVERAEGADESAEGADGTAPESRPRRRSRLEIG